MHTARASQAALLLTAPSPSTTPSHAGVLSSLGRSGKRGLPILRISAPGLDRLIASAGGEGGRVFDRGQDRVYLPAEELHGQEVVVKVPRALFWSALPPALRSIRPQPLPGTPLLAEPPLDTPWAEGPCSLVAKRIRLFLDLPAAVVGLEQLVAICPERYALVFSRARGEPLSALLARAAVPLQPADSAGAAAVEACKAAEMAAARVLPWRVRWQVASQLSEILAALHKEGIVHMNVKPGEGRNDCSGVRRSAIQKLSA